MSSAAAATSAAHQPPSNPLQKMAQMAAKVPKVPNLGDLTGKLDEKFAGATNFIAQALPSFPAGVLGSLALGLPHAHLAHPPFIPLPPFGAVILGFSVNVLIGGMPAARSGALGISPTCCGLTPFFEVFTGSSKVFISGERAVRMTDITFHCKPTPTPPPAAAAACGTMGQIARAAGTAYRAASAVSSAAQKVGQVASTADSIVTAATTKNAALRGAIVESMAMNVAGMIAQKVQDAIKDAMAKAMGKDPPTPPTGTPGMILLGVPNVIIGGFPMPSWSAIASGLMRMLPGKLQARLSGYQAAFSGAG